jgi:hypothetical protein
MQCCFLVLGSLHLFGLSVFDIVCIRYTEFSPCEVHVTETQFRCFVAIGSLPQTLPRLVVTVDHELDGTGLNLVTSDASLYILHLKRLSL